jgi:hypothetical protein
MNRQDLINRLVARKLQPTGGPKAACVPCLAAKPSNLCWVGNNVKALCLPAGTKN